VKTFMEAIAQMEGFNVAGTRPARNFNPGDIEYGDFAREHGAVGTDGRFAIFPDAPTGYAAMRALLMEHYVGLTIAAALNKWAPPVENNVSAYLSGVCEMTGLTPETVLTSELLT
jgi:hypothetical protein